MTAFDLPTVGTPSTQKPDARTVNDGGQDVMRQVVVIGDPTNPAAVLPIKAEDTASADGDFGIPILGVRRDSDSASVGADGDYTNLKMDEAGRLKVAAAPASQAQTTGTIAANGQTVFADVSRASNIMIHCFGTFSTINCIFEGSLNSTNGTDGNWFTIQAVRSSANTIETATGNLSAAPAYGWELSVNGLKYFRLRATAFTSGTQSWVIQPAPYATEPIPAAQISGTQPVSGSLTTAGTCTPIPSTAQGASTHHHLISAATTNATSVKASVGVITNITLSNNGAAAAYFKLHNKASAPTVGTDTPIRTIMIPAGDSISVECGPHGIRCATGIAYCLTTGMAVADTGAVALSQISVGISYT